MADPVRIQAIKDELTNDPAVLGYAAPNAGIEATAIADLALMNVVDRIVDVETLSASQLFEAIDATEWTARTVDQKDDIRLVLALGDNIQISAGTKARAILQNALTGATTSLSNLGALGSKTVSRAEELGFGRVTIGEIQAARVS